MPPISTFFLWRQPLAYSAVTCSLPNENKLWHHPILMECISPHFIHEIKKKGYDVICINEFPPKIMRFPRKKPDNSVPPSLLAWNQLPTQNIKNVLKTYFYQIARWIHWWRYFSISRQITVAKTLQTRLCIFNLITTSFPPSINSHYGLNWTKFWT